MHGLRNVSPREEGSVSVFGWILVMVGYVGPGVRVRAGAACEIGSGKLATNKAVANLMASMWAIRVLTKWTNSGSHASWFLDHRGRCWPQEQRKTNSQKRF